MTSSPPAEPRTLAGLRLALTTFSVLPLPAGPVDRSIAGAAMTWAALVGTGLGGALALGCVLLRHAFPHGWLLIAVLAIGVSALLTRGLHLDGLADTVDGLGSYGGPDKALAVMKAPDIGPFGVVALLFVLLLDVAALETSLSAGRGTVALLVAFTTGRLAVTWSCTPRTPSARPEGLGALVAGTTSARTAALLTAAIACLAAVLAASTGHHHTEDTVRAVAAVIVPIAVAHGLRAHLVHRFGGITGDVLGALVEVTTAVSLLVMAVGAA